MEFTGICKYFTRSVWKINKIPLGVMTSNYPQGKSLPFKTVGVAICFRGKKGITLGICHLVSHQISEGEGTVDGGR